MRRSYTIFLSIGLIITLSVVFLNAGKNDGEKKLSLNSFLIKQKRLKPEWLKIIKAETNVKNFEVFQLKVPRKFIPDDRFKLLSANLMGERFDLFRQLANSPRKNSYYYSGELLNENSRERVGIASITYQRGVASGHIKLRDKYARVIGLGKNVFALVEYYDQPNYECKTDLGAIAQNNSSPKNESINDNQVEEPSSIIDNINSIPIDNTIIDPNNGQLKPRKFLR